jgi:hypothetical protein
MAFYRDPAQCKTGPVHSQRNVSVETNVVAANIRDFFARRRGERAVTLVRLAFRAAALRRQDESTRTHHDDD